MADKKGFASALRYALFKRGMPELYLKTKQRTALEAVVRDERDTLVILPTGYGKSLIYQLLPDMFNFMRDQDNCVVLVVSPLTALMMDQKNSLKGMGITATIVCHKDGTSKGNESGFIEECDFEKDQEFEKASVIFAHPEVLTTSKAFREILLSDKFQENVVCVVADEAHCIVDWGHEFRPEYGNLSCLASVFPAKPFLAMTATAPKAYQDVIISKFGMRNPVKIIENPNRPNIFYEVITRPPSNKECNEDQFENLLTEIADELKLQKEKYPLTVIYTSLELCGSGFTFLQQKLGGDQYFPSGAEALPKHRLFAQFHSPQSKKMKEEILSNVTEVNPTQRVLLVTIAFGMGIDSPCIERVIHFGVPRRMEHYHQESGRAGRKGQPAKATLHYNNSDISANRDGMSDVMREYCRNENSKCRRNIILNYFDFSKPNSESLHLCCDVCLKSCNCEICKSDSSLLKPLNTVVDDDDALAQMHIVTCSSVQRVKLKEKLEQYRLSLGKPTRFGVGKSVGLTCDVINVICNKVEMFQSCDDVKANLPLWRDEQAADIFKIIQEVIQGTRTCTYI